jgi:hypothetical protein
VEVPELEIAPCIHPISFLFECPTASSVQQSDRNHALSPANRSVLKVRQRLDVLYQGVETKTAQPRWLG